MSRKCAAGGSVVVVVSPLISLMEDQVASLRKHHKWEGANDACVVTWLGVCRSILIYLLRSYAYECFPPLGTDESFGSTEKVTVFAKISRQ